MSKQYIMFFIALAISLMTTPLVIKFAAKIGAMDVPTDNRRMHKEPVPLLGGLAIYFAFVSTLLVFVRPDRQVTGILLGGTFIIIGGVVDDLRPLKPKEKLLLQIIGACIVAYFGIGIKYVTNPFDRAYGRSDIGWLSLPATVFWIVGITNAFNLIDGLDGLAAGIAFISSVTLFAISLMNDRTMAVVMTATLAGCTLGFLPYNFNPAKIFMGDSGAQFLGFMLAVISIQGAIKSAAAIVIMVPVLVLGLPIYDTLTSMFRRMMDKKPVMQADKGHIHHKLMDMGLTQKQAVFVLYAISALFGVSAIFVMELNMLRGFAVVIIVFFFILMLTRKMGMLKRKNEGN